MNATRKLGILGVLGFAVSMMLLVAPLAASAGGGTVVSATPPARTMLLGNLVTFQESGLPLVTSWSVTLNGSTSSALAPLSNTYLENNGVYAYTIGTVTGYTASPASGTVTVNNSNVNVKVSFTAASSTHATYPATFTESGLASGTSWSLQINGTSASRMAPASIVFNLTNGTYSFTVGSVDGYTASPASGSVTVHGAAVSTAIIFGADIQHAVVIVLENYELSAVLAGAPYQSYLWNHYGQASNFDAECHFSYPDYAAMTSGRYFACGNASIPIQGVTNLADLFEQANLSWMGYFESMSSACQVTSTGSYVAYHDPFILYKDIRYNATRCDAHVVNSASFNSSVMNGTLPALSYYVPNIYDDCYVSGLAFCDKWLKSFLSPMLNSTSTAEQQLMAHTAFFLVYDEGSTNAGYSVGGVVNSWCQNTTHQALSACGGHIWMTVVSPYSLGTKYTGNATDYNLESTVEWLFGLGSDGGNDGTHNFPAMSSLFTFAQNGKVSTLAQLAPSSGGTSAVLSTLRLVTPVPLLGAAAGASLGSGIALYWRRARRVAPTRRAEQDGREPERKDPR